MGIWNTHDRTDYWFSGPSCPNHRRLEPICTWSAVNVIQLSVLICTLEVRYRRKEICFEVWTNKKDTPEVCGRNVLARASSEKSPRLHLLRPPPHCLTGQYSS